jgi:flagellar hook-associated protein 3 FlgL
MRIATRSFQLQFLAALTQQQNRLARVQQQAATGKKVLSAGDDPAAAVQIVALDNSLKQLVSYETNASIARGRLSLEEQSLNNVVGSLQRLRDLVIDARGPGKTEVELKLIAAEAQGIFDGILDTANSQDGEGRYLFGGNRVQSPPYALAPGGVVYSGDQGARMQRISESRVVQEGDSGAEVFGRIRSGNGTFTVGSNAGNLGTAFFATSTVADPAAWDGGPYTIQFTAPDAYEVRDSLGAVVVSGAYTSVDTIAFRGVAISFEGEPVAGDSFSVQASQYQSVFDSVQNLVGVLQSSVTTGSQRAEFQGDTNSVLLDLDRALDHISEVRSSVGQRISVLDEQQSANDNFSIEVQKVLSRAQDADLASVISELEAQAFALEAAQRSFARIQNQSLFDLI